MQQTTVSPIRKQATEVLRRARQLPIGPNRNDLRQLANGLRRLEKQEIEAMGGGGGASQAMPDQRR